MLNSVKRPRAVRDAFVAMAVRRPQNASVARAGEGLVSLPSPARPAAARRPSSSGTSWAPLASRTFASSTTTCTLRSAAGTRWNRCAPRSPLARASVRGPSRAVRRRVGAFLMRTRGLGATTAPSCNGHRIACAATRARRARASCAHPHARGCSRCPACAASPYECALVGPGRDARSLHVHSPPCAGCQEQAAHAGKAACAQSDGCGIVGVMRTASRGRTHEDEMSLRPSGETLSCSGHQRCDPRIYARVRVPDHNRSAGFESSERLAMYIARGATKRARAPPSRGRALGWRLGRAERRDAKAEIFALLERALDKVAVVGVERVV